MIRADRRSKDALGLCFKGIFIRRMIPFGRMTLQRTFAAFCRPRQKKLGLFWQDLN